MGNAIKQMFRTFTAFFAALEMFSTALMPLANSAKNLADWTDETTGTFLDKSRIERMAERKKLELENGVTISA